MSLTRAVVEEALTHEITQSDDGTWGCRVCPRTFPVKTSVPVHEIVHRREVGLAPPVMKGHGGVRAPKTVVCGYDGCREVMNRPSLISHLQGKTIHNLSRRDAVFYARQRNEQDRAVANGNGHVPAVIEQPSPAEASEPISPLSDIEAVEAVTGILMAARTDKVIPTRLLPEAYNLIRHTEAVLGELRRLTEKQT